MRGQRSGLGAAGTSHQWGLSNSPRQCNLGESGSATSGVKETEHLELGPQGRASCSQKSSFLRKGSSGTWELVGNAVLQSHPRTLRPKLCSWGQTVFFYAPVILTRKLENLKATVPRGDTLYSQSLFSNARRPRGQAGRGGPGQPVSCCGDGSPRAGGPEVDLLATELGLPVWVGRQRQSLVKGMLYAAPSQANNRSTGPSLHGHFSAPVPLTRK